MKKTDEFIKVVPHHKFKKQLNVMGISAGNGVIVYPISKDDNFTLMGNVEVRPGYFYKKMPIQWALNFPKIPFYPMIPPIQDVDIIIGNPKCGAYSNFSNFQERKDFSKMGVNEPSLANFIDSVNNLNPRLFLMENLVKLNEVVDLYRVFPNHDLYQIVGSVSMFGNSQFTRTRLIVIGVTKGLKQFGDLMEPFRVNNIKPVGELLADLPENGHWVPAMSDLIQIYQGVKVTYQEAMDYWKEHKYRYQWFMQHPKKADKILTAPGVYRLKTFDFPLTVRASPKQFSPDLLEMSGRQLARLQGVPDEFLLIDDARKPSYADTKNKTTVCNTPPMEVGEWFRQLVYKLEKAGLFEAEPKVKKHKKHLKKHKKHLKKHKKISKHNIK